jgi:hypothetical protein
MFGSHKIKASTPEDIALRKQALDMVIAAGTSELNSDGLRVTMGAYKLVRRAHTFYKFLKNGTQAEE